MGSTQAGVTEYNPDRVTPSCSASHEIGPESETKQEQRKEEEEERRRRESDRPKLHFDTPTFLISESAPLIAIRLIKTEVAIMARGDALTHEEPDPHKASCLRLVSIDLTTASRL